MLQTNIESLQSLLPVRRSQYSPLRFLKASPPRFPRGQFDRGRLNTQERAKGGFNPRPTAAEEHIMSMGVDMDYRNVSRPV